MQGKIMESGQELNNIIHLGNRTKRGGGINYTPVIGYINCRLGKSKFCSLRILLDFGVSSSIVLGKHTKQYVKKYPTG